MLLKSAVGQHFPELVFVLLLKNTDPNSTENWRNETLLSKEKERN